MLSERTIQFQKTIEGLLDAGVRKTTFYSLIAQSLRQTHGQPRLIRRAKAFAYLLENVEQKVHPHELLGGSIVGMWPVDETVPDFQTQFDQARDMIETYIREKGAPKASSDISLRFEVQSARAALGRFAMMARDHFNGNILYTRLQEINQRLIEQYARRTDISAAEIVKLTEEFFTYDYGEEVMREVDDLPWSSANHVNLNYDTVLTQGFGGILASAQAAKAKTQDAEKLVFYEAVDISLRSAMAFIRRYADTYRHAAEAEKDGVRGAEMTDIAAMLEKIAVAPPDSFYEAVQAVWITHLIQSIALGSALSFARFDQYMFRFYQADVQTGRITREWAMQILQCLWLKVNEPKMRTVQSMTLAGITPQGDDASNELTALCLDVTASLRLPYPNVGVRINLEKTPEWVYDKSIATIQRGFGMPMLINDDAWIPKFLKLGYPLAYARDYYNMGCVEMMIPGKQSDWLAATGGFVSYPQVLEALLREWDEGKVAFDTFDAFFERYLLKLRERIEYGEGVARRQITLIRENSCDPFASALIDDCIGRGKDMFSGGTLCPAHVALNGYGMATVVDSCMVIKKLLFEARKLSIHEICAATRGNFAGCEAMLRMIDREVPKYGNDIDEADELMQRLLSCMVDMVFAMNDGAFAEKFVTSYFSYTRNVSIGEATNATPNGRRLGEPLSDALGPSQGCDVCGPTRMLNSITKLDTSRLTGAVATNLKVNASLFANEAGTNALKTLLKVHLMQGGPQIQVNFVRLEDLKAAQRNPKEYRNLVVRVAGFCEYFVNLDAKQQGEIIKRTEHEMG